MSKSPSRLGRGLNALISNREHSATPAAAHAPAAVPAAHGVADGPHIRSIPVDRITPNRHQPRTTFNDATIRELADSIKANGVLQPIVVRSAADGAFELVAGERRWRAATLAGLTTVPAVVRDLTDAQSFEIALIENLQREDLGPLERAAAYQHYLDTFGGTIEDLGQRLSESRANISNYLRILKLRPEICYMIGAGELGMGQARAIAGIADPQRQLALANLAARRNLSVRQVEELTRQASETTTEAEAERAPSEETLGRRHHFRDLEAALSKGLGMRVRVFPGKKKNSGRIVVAYNNLSEFDALAERLGGDAHLE
jgi:ParB family transcriptional regulator, chromosome partitioning protein